MSKEDNPSIEKLFGSKTRAKLLDLFFSDTGKSYYVREITRMIEEQINSVRRELINLESIGIVKSETYDNKVYYSANLRSPYAHAFQELFNPRKTAGSVGPAGPMLTSAAVNANQTSGAVEVHHVSRANTWAENIKPVEKYLRGLMVINQLPGQQGVDMLIIGDDRTKKLTRWAEVVEKRQGKPMNYVIMSRDDFLYRKSVRDRFVMGLLDMDLTYVYDPEKMIKTE